MGKSKENRIRWTTKFKFLENMARTKIEWTDVTWNPTTGCTKISAGCKNCYAERMAKRLQLMGIEKYKDGFSLRLHHQALSIPYSWKKRSFVFVNSMSDLFHEDIPFEFIQKVFKVMNDNHLHIFQVLTKRTNVLLEYANYLNWTENIWIGATVESQNYTHRIDDLRSVKAHIKFLSFEPLIGEIANLNLYNIDWVIVGGESGPNARFMDKKWVTEIKNQCQKQNVPFFFKQWGGTNKRKSGRILEGRTWDEKPILLEHT